MKSGGSKAKGSAWERQLSKILTKWLTGQDKEYYFYRSPGSGALATVNFGNKTLSGDLIAIKLEGSFFTEIFNIEAKNGYENASFDKFLKDNKNDVLQAFWNQSVRDAEKSDKLPLVMFKKKGMPNPWLCFCSKTFEKTKKLIKDIKLISLYYGTETIYVCNLTDFLAKVSPNDIKKLWK